MSQPLANLPPQVRQQVELMLSKLPEATRQQVLNSPMLKKIIERAEQEMQGGGGARIAQAARAATRGADSPLRAAPRLETHGHYNSTIQPGDRVSLRGWAFLLIFLGGVVWVMSQL